MIRKRSNYLDRGRFQTTAPTPSHLVRNPVDGTTPTESMRDGDFRARMRLIDKELRSRNFISGSDGWQIQADGDAEFNSITVRGEVQSESGSIGGWDITNTTLENNNVTMDSGGELTIGAGNDIVALSSQDSTYRLWAGNSSPGNAPTTLQKDGTFTTTNGDFTGKITSDSGTIGGWSITNTTLENSNVTLNSNGELTIGAGNDVVGLSSQNSTYRLWAGNSSPGNAPTTLKKDGTFSTTNGNFTGSVSSSNISGSSITGGDISIGGGDFKVESDGDIRVNRGSLNINNNFDVNSNGRLTANGAQIDGRLDVTQNSSFSANIDVSSTITGGTIRTSSGGKRVILNEFDNNNIVLRDGEDDIRIQIDENSINYHDDSGTQRNYIKGTNDGSIEVSSEGTNNNSFDVFTDTLYCTGTVVARADLEVNQDRNLKFSGDKVFATIDDWDNTGANRNVTGFMINEFVNYNHVAIGYENSGGEVAFVTDQGSSNPETTAYIDSSGNYVNVSTQEVKSEVQPLNTNSLTGLNKITPKTYTKGETEDGTPRRQAGLIAEDVNDISELTGVVSDGGRGLIYDNFVPHLINAIQELSAELEQLKQSVAQ
jgi:hypothetical protein